MKLLNWFEDHPRVRGLVILGWALACAAAFAFFMWLAGGAPAFPWR